MENGSKTSVSEHCERETRLLSTPLGRTESLGSPIALKSVRFCLSPKSRPYSLTILASRLNMTCLFIILLVCFCGLFSNLSSIQFSRKFIRKSDWRRTPTEFEAIEVMTKMYSLRIQCADFPFDQLFWRHFFRIVMIDWVFRSDGNIIDRCFSNVPYGASN